MRDEHLPVVEAPGWAANPNSIIISNKKREIVWSRARAVARSPRAIVVTMRLFQDCACSRPSAQTCRARRHNYTEADVGNPVVGDAKGIADHVRLLRYRGSD